MGSVYPFPGKKSRKNETPHSQIQLQLRVGKTGHRREKRANTQVRPYRILLSGAVMTAPYNLVKAAARRTAITDSGLFCLSQTLCHLD